MPLIKGDHLTDPFLNLLPKNQYQDNRKEVSINKVNENKEPRTKTCLVTVVTREHF